MVPKKYKLPLISALLAVISSDYVYDILKDTDAFCKKLGFSKTPDLIKWLHFYSHEDIFLELLEIWFIEELKKPAFKNLIGQS